MRNLPLILGALFCALLLATIVPAYQRATVQARISLAVVPSSQGLLSLSSVSPQATQTGGQWAVDFRLGNDGRFYGLKSAQTVSSLSVPASTITFVDAFRLTNQSASCVTINIRPPAGQAAPLGLTTIAGRPLGQTQAASTLWQSSGPVPYSLSAGQTLQVDLTWFGTAPVSARPFTLQVSGETGC